MSITTKDFNDMKGFFLMGSTRNGVQVRGVLVKADDMFFTLKSKTGNTSIVRIEDLSEFALAEFREVPK